MKRILYFFYYLKKLDWKKFNSFTNYTLQNSSKSRLRLYFDIFSSSIKYNISILDYYYFHFYKLSHTEREEYAGTGTMYEYQLGMNPKENRDQLENKAKFLTRYKPFVIRQFFFLEDLKKDMGVVTNLLKNETGKIVVKLATGQVGAEVKVLKTENLTPQSLVDLMEKRGFDLVEEYVIQHSELMRLSPSGLNTIRLITQVVDGTVLFLGARLRISVNSPVDNLGAGNIACPVDLKSGKINGAGIYSDITKSDEEVHPVTKAILKGFQIPFWQEAIKMVERAALHDTSNRSIGWDVAISEKGPELIEGNHNWCKLLWQLPVKKGLKFEIEKLAK